MWKCHKCGKPVYFAERKQSLGFDWHPECLRCEECGRRLLPGQHAEHKGQPYCHVPCYGALFGPQLFGHGTRVESHTSYGCMTNNRDNAERQQLELKLKEYNQFFEGRSCEIRSREVNNRLVLEGALRIYWGVCGVIHLKEEDDQRTVTTVRRRNSTRYLSDEDSDLEDDITLEPVNKQTDLAKLGSNTLPAVKKPEKPDEIDELLTVTKAPEVGDSNFHTLHNHELQAGSDIATPSSDISADTDGYSAAFESSLEGNTLTRSVSGPDFFDKLLEDESTLTTKMSKILRSFSTPEQLNNGQTSEAKSTFPYDDSLKRYLNASYQSQTENDLPPIVLRRPKGSSAIRRRAGRKRARNKVKRRCSINGHFYNRETSFFTPPYGSQASVWVTSLVATSDVIAQLLDKYKVDSVVENFALFIVRDNGERRRLRDDEYPLVVRVMLGPHEDVARLFLMDARNTQEISSEVAMFLNLSEAECSNILAQYQQEEEREIKRIRLKYRDLRKAIKERMDELKVRL